MFLCEIHFTQAEWEEFGIHKLRSADFIESDGCYFKPVGKDDVLSPKHAVQVRTATRKVLAEEAKNALAASAKALAALALPQDATFTR